MKSVLKKAEKATKLLKSLNPKDLRLIKTKIATDNSDTGHFRLKAILNDSDFVEIFEFYLESELIKYSYSFISKDSCILRYDNAPHHKSLTSFPDHKHIYEKVEEINKVGLKHFIIEIGKLKKNSGKEHNKK